jgi:hypothetical protein
VVAGETAPRPAGREYLVDAMRSFANGERAAMKGLSTMEREAIARYLSSL